MRTENYRNILIIIAAVLISLIQYPEKMTVRAATQSRVAIATTETPIAMISAQNSETSAPTTRMVIDRFNEAFNRHDADALVSLAHR